MEVPEKCEIPGMVRIGELFCTENSSIFFIYFRNLYIDQLDDIDQMT